jgi:acyl carrier protein
VNNYGPTESTVVATSGIVPPDTGCPAPPSIGRPIANVQIQILDERLQPVPAGAVGELYIGGASLARGYLNRPEDTARRFVPDPSSNSGARLYRTGDLACHLPDGQIAFRGRADDQIKIRGHRIEPAEIVLALNAHPSVRASAVIARDDLGLARLVAYAVLEPGSHPTHETLCGFLRAKLPEYMIPAAIVCVDGLPLTAHGKIDRAALPPPDDHNQLRERQPARERSAVEERVAGVVSELLGLPAVEPDDNFFELGGHSLLAAQMITRLRETFGVELSLLSLFEAPSVAQLSAKIERAILAKVDALSEADVQRLLATGRETVGVGT